METQICFPAPLEVCFPVASGGTRPILEDSEDYFEDDTLLSDASAIEKLRASDPEGCFLCMIDALGDED